MCKGWLAVIIGIFLGGVGVVPIGMLAAIFNGEWGILGTLFMCIVLTYGSRAIGTMLVESSEIQSENSESNTGEEIIDVEPVTHKRAWEDIEQ